MEVGSQRAVSNAAVVASLVLVACARGNPQFDAADQGPTGSDSTKGPPDTSTSDSDAVTTDGPPVVTTSADSGPGGSTATDPDTGIDTTPATDGSGEPMCNLPDPVAVAIAVRLGNGDVVEPDCAGGSLLTTLGPLSEAGHELVAGNCGMCGCQGEPGGTIIVSVANAVPIGIPPDCGRLYVWPQVQPNGVCTWAGVATLAQNETIPAWLATDSRTIPADLTAGAVVGLVDVEPCLVGDCASAGLKALEFGNAATIEMGTPPTVVELPFGASIPYEVENLTSLVLAVASQANREGAVQLSGWMPSWPGWAWRW